MNCPARTIMAVLVLAAMLIPIPLVAAGAQVNEMPLDAATLSRWDRVRRLLDTVKARNPNVLLIHRPEGGHDTTYSDSKTAIEFVVSRVLTGPSGKK